MAFIAESKVAKRYGVCQRTLDRWDGQAELCFPPPVWINGRKYRDSEKLLFGSELKAILEHPDVPRVLLSTAARPLSAVVSVLAELLRRTEPRPAHSR